MKNLSGWSLLWITLSVTCVIGTVAKIIIVHKAKEADAKKADAVPTTRVFDDFNPPIMDMWT